MRWGGSDGSTYRTTCGEHTCLHYWICIIWDSGDYLHIDFELQAGESERADGRTYQDNAADNAEHKKMIHEHDVDEIVDYINSIIGRKDEYWDKESFARWLQSRQNVGIRFDDMLIYRAYRIWCELHDEGDHFTVVSGPEGKGKSTLAIQLASLVSPNFDTNDICYTARQLVEKLTYIAENYTKGNKKKDIEDKTILLDEGGLELFARESMRAGNIALTKIFFVQRFLNVHVIVCIPNFYMLDGVVRDHRVKTLIQIPKRGLYRAITGFGIKQVNILAKKFNKDVMYIPVNDGCYWDGRFDVDFPTTINKDDYESHKLDNIRRVLKGLNYMFDEKKKQEDEILKLIERIKNVAEREK